MVKKSVRLYEAEIATLLSLPEEQRGKILTAILATSIGAQLPEMDAMETAVYTLVNGQVQRAEEMSKKRKQAVQTRWSDDANAQTNDTNAQQSDVIADANDTTEVADDTNTIQNDTNAESEDTTPYTITTTNTNTITTTNTPTITTTTTEQVRGVREAPPQRARAQAAKPPAQFATEPSALPEPSVAVAVQGLYNDICISFPKCSMLSEKRAKAINARFRTGATLGDFEKCFAKAQTSDFLKGGNNRNWLATFDWLIADGNMAKVLDGNYDNSDKQKPPNKPNSTGFSTSNPFLEIYKEEYSE